MYKHPLPLASTAHPCAFCLTALDLLPRSLLAPSALQCKPVFLPLTLSGCPPFDTLDVVSVPANSCGFSLLGSVLPLPFLEPLLPPSNLDLRPVPWRSKGGSCLQLLVSCPPPPFFLFTQSCDSPSLGVFWQFGVLWAPFCALTRGLGVSTPWQSPAPALVPAILGRAGAVQATWNPHNSHPYTHPLCRLDPIPFSLCGLQI